MIHKIEKDGEFKIPWGYAEELHVREGDMVEILLRGNEVVIKRLQFSCIFCSSVVKLVRIGRLCVCRLCIERLNEAEDGGYLYPASRE